MDTLLSVIIELERKAPGLDDLHHSFAGVYRERISAVLDAMGIEPEYRRFFIDPWDLDKLDESLQKLDAGGGLSGLRDNMQEFMARLREAYMCELDQIIAEAGAHLPALLSYPEKSLVILYNLNRLCTAQQQLIAEMQKLVPA